MAVVDLRSQQQDKLAGMAVQCRSKEKEARWGRAGREGRAGRSGGRGGGPF